jgi:GntR family transcriptional regulator, transcriptional repressor for pyruvate dehydrogenase complex
MSDSDVTSDRAGRSRAAGRKRAPKRPVVIAEQIKDWIVEQNLKPGDRLPGERDLIVRLHASKSTTREALKVLETQGLIVTRTGPGGGTFVKALSETQAVELLGNYFFFKNPTIRDIYTLRKLLEPELAASVVGRLTDANFRHLESTMRIYAYPPENLVEERLQRHAELDFHSILASLCPNPVLGFVCRFLHSLLRDLTVCRRIYDTPNPDLRMSGHSFQVMLIQGLKRKDERAVRQIMFDHMVTAQAHMEEREAVVQAGFLRLNDTMDVKQDQPPLQAGVRTADEG